MKSSASHLNVAAQFRMAVYLEQSLVIFYSQTIITAYGSSSFSVSLTAPPVLVSFNFSLSSDSVF